VLDIPVITAGRIGFAEADAHIRDGHFDFVAMGRKLLADPHLARKLSEGREDDVRPCIYCYTCISQIYFWRWCRRPPGNGLRSWAVARPAWRRHAGWRSRVMR
jgi:2,4-dienoyl-CoA reductase-like NADH-dependent reductase (Old Yellow Enzyme family)